ncbi:hypothetical protein BDE36_3493 [Arcticibacter tournemirensis]|uniref:Uncharacterized protein n=1 Tax=Arcticibacter tournemirensis TaxID=699437 RepID=A0A5M9H883_9SPHI|nr:hypothetical protein [Arcticibacter tournemirensis]KAA8482405.1 hypothetical protein F1649_11885 [Arcticibacter tournemirensis]TQM51710.1 hypothetical protein BDE36_3493 [Arcticibacter tournemirensis]
MSGNGTSGLKSSISLGKELSQNGATFEGIADFVSAYSQEESKALLWLLLKCSISGNLLTLNSTERQNLLTFYEHLDGLLSEVYLEYNHGNESINDFPALNSENSGNIQPGIISKKGEKDHV